MYLFKPDIDNCLRVLQAGGLILYPTDTIWGIGCDATNPDAVSKVYRLKKRSDEKSLIVLVADEKAILHHVTKPDLQVFDYLKRTRKPTTVVYEGAVGLATNLVASDGTVAIRICREPFCHELITKFEKPLVSTSANLSGHPYPANFSEVTAEIKNGVDYIVSYRQQDLTAAKPSTLVKWEKGSPVPLRR